MKSISTASDRASLALSKITATVVATAAGGLFALGMSQPASATVLTNVNDTFDVTFSVDIISTTPESTVPVGETLTLSATITYTLKAIDTTANTATIEVKVENTSTATAGLDILAPAPQARVDIGVMGFNINPEASPVAISGGSVFDFAGLDQIPNLKLIEVCASAKSCSTGGGDGIGPPESDTFELALTFDSLTSGVEILNTGLKFQTDFGSFEITENGNGGFLIPEPASLLLFGIGLLGLGVFVRRRGFAA